MPVRREREYAAGGDAVKGSLFPGPSPFEYLAAPEGRWWAITVGTLRRIDYF